MVGRGLGTLCCSYLSSCWRLAVGCQTQRKQRRSPAESSSAAPGCAAAPGLGHGEASTKSLSLEEQRGKGMYQVPIARKASAELRYWVLRSLSSYEGCLLVVKS